MLIDRCFRLLKEKMAFDSPRQFFLFIITGIVNTIFGYCCFAMLIYLGLHYSLAAFFGTILGVTFNFFSTGQIVFSNRNHKKMPKFFAVYGFLYCINVLWLKIMTEMGFSAYTAGAIGLVPMAFASFVLNKLLVFTHEKTD